jgi:SAM-dependent methyltransferase
MTQAAPSILDCLRCPSCREPFRESVPSLLQCSCRTAPVLAGIPILLDASFALDALRELRSGRGERALSRALAAFAPPRSVVERIARRLGRVPARRIGDLLRDPGLTFESAAEALGRAREASYFAGRPDQRPFAVGRSLLEAAPSGPVLDLGCGAGHLAAACPGRVVVGLDASFPLLYLARRFVHPSGLFVCADACRPLPFAEGAFAAAFSMDVFQYLPARDRTAVEMDRVTRADGRVILSHLRDRLEHSPHEAPSLPPRAYADFFASREVSFCSEEAGSLPAGPERIDPARPYALVAGKRRS